VKLQFLPLARVELRAATAYYKAINPELAVSFKNEALDVRKLIEEHPEAWHPLSLRIGSAASIDSPTPLSTRCWKPK